MTRCVTCICATHGRFSRLRESLACFLSQTYPHRELLILNQHPVPIVCDIPGVRVVNESHHATLRDVRFRQLELCCTDFVSQWDDDDIYLPHHLETAMQNIGTASAWKPKQSWMREGDTAFMLTENVMEASWVYRRDAAARFDISDYPNHDEHPVFHGLSSEIRVETPLESRTSFVMAWADGGFHLSGSFGAASKAVRTLAWKRMNQDHGNGVPLTPVSLASRWTALYRFIRIHYPNDREWFARLVLDRITGHGQTTNEKDSTH